MEHVHACMMSHCRLLLLCHRPCRRRHLTIFADMLCPLSPGTQLRDDVDVDRCSCCTAHLKTLYSAACCDDERCWMQVLNAALLGAAEPTQSADLVAGGGEG